MINLFSCFLLFLRAYKAEEIIFIDASQNLSLSSPKSYSSLETFFTDLKLQTLPSDLYKIFIMSNTNLTGSFNLMSYALDFM